MHVTWCVERPWRWDAEVLRCAGSCWTLRRLRRWTGKEAAGRRGWARTGRGGRKRKVHARSRDRPAVAAFLKRSRPSKDQPSPDIGVGLGVGLPRLRRRLWLRWGRHWLGCLDLLDRRWRRHHGDTALVDLKEKVHLWQERPWQSRQPLGFTLRPVGKGAQEPLSLGSLWQRSRSTGRCHLS